MRGFGRQFICWNVTSEPKRQVGVNIFVRIAFYISRSSRLTAGQTSHVLALDVLLRVVRMLFAALLPKGGVS